MLPAFVRTAGSLVWLSALLGGCATSPRPPLPVTATISGRPGGILLREPLPGAPRGAKAWRVLYVSQGMQGERIPVSGVVIVPAGPAPAQGRDVIAWAHPTTGVSDKCAPSLRATFFKRLPGLEDMLERGFVVAATDYPGLGTPGPHPYLVGESEGRAVLDSVRAAGRLVQTSGRFGLWGHSQGGQAVLFAGQMARSYAPEWKLCGIAAAAPATNLTALLDADIATPVGKVLGCYALWSWSRIYGVPQNRIFDPRYNAQLDAITSTCVQSLEQGLQITRFAKKLPNDFLLAEPAKVEPWKSLLRRNTPGQAPAGAPLFISQGTEDPIVHYGLTVAFVAKLRQNGEQVDFLPLPGVKHNPAGRVSAPDAVDWLAQRLRGSINPAGVWSAPSLSRPGQPIVVTLNVNGQALEQIGDFHGKSIWKLEGDAARIRWASGWAGLLRPAAGGGWELATWKKGNSLSRAPDDIQPAQRLTPRGNP
jgi:acetyl esterase/lipase